MFNSTDYLSGQFIEKLSADKYNCYWAHLRNDEKETLFEHTKLVAEYGNKLLEINGLKSIVDNLLLGFIADKYSEANKNDALHYLKNLFYSTLAYHDAGKVNPNFQHTKMLNKAFHKTNNSLGSDHAKIGAYTFIQDFMPIAISEQFDNKTKIYNLYALLAFATVMLKHHAPQLEYTQKFNFDNEFIDDALFLLKEIDVINYTGDQQKVLIKNFNGKFLPSLHEYLKTDTPFFLFSLLKLNYSLLTASDYMATTHYMDNWPDIPTDFGILTNELKKKIVFNCENIKAYNKKTYNELESCQINFPKEQSNKSLNQLRQNLSIEIIKGIRENTNKHLFYIEAPTGGGKTNLSMLAVTELLKNDLLKDEDSIKRIYYIFPFTTLITQTYLSLKETLGLDNNEIVQIHSKSGFTSKTTEQYGSGKENIIDYQFLNYPVSLISHIRFFDILKSNRKSTNYILHRLANSVVIIDELQSYTPKHWDKVIYFINQYASLFNIRFILMSATLPKIEALLSHESEEEKKYYEKFVYLNKHKEEYFTNPNFKNRVKIDYTLLEGVDFKKMMPEKQLSVLWRKVNDYSKSYIERGNPRVHTIIEFIFKKTASKFQEKAINENNFFDEIFILSGTILEPRRKEIINKLKSKEYAEKNILLITTQVVEAGVDIDMDLGFKDTSLIDSDEQLAGRINRNVNKQECKLHLFDLDDAKVIYGNDDRYQKQQIELRKEYKTILETKNFDKVYNCVMQSRNEINSQKGGYINLSSYKKSMLKLDFRTVDSEFKLIENSYSTETLFIPVNVPVEIPLSSLKNFEKKELEFLIDKGKHVKDDEFVSGEKVWQLYEEIIQNKHSDFSSTRIQKIIMQGLISKFTISVGTYTSEFKNALAQGAVEERYGFYYLNYIEEVYSYESGLKPCNVDTAIIF